MGYQTDQNTMPFPGFKDAFTEPTRVQGVVSGDANNRTLEPTVQIEHVPPDYRPHWDRPISRKKRRRRVKGKVGTRRYKSSRQKEVRIPTPSLNPWPFAKFFLKIAILIGLGFSIYYAIDQRMHRNLLTHLSLPKWTQKTTEIAGPKKKPMQKIAPKRQQSEVKRSSKPLARRYSRPSSPRKKLPL